MEIAGVIERVERIGVVRSNPAADTDLIKTGLVAVREARAWLDAQHAGLVTQLRAVDSFPEQAVAEAAKASLGQAAKSTERSTTLHATPKLSDALANGAITAEHVDAVTRASKKLDGAKRNELIKRADALAAVATAGTVEQFARRLDLERKRLEEDDGLDRLARQRRNARARSWVDVEGMWNLSVRLDPLTGVSVAARIDAMVQALFANVVPDECPSDPIEKQRHLNARAVTQLLLDEALGNTSGPRPTRQRPGAPEFVAVIDADATGQCGPVVEFSIPVEIPARVLADLAGTADRAQRRALRGLYRTCGIPGCSVGYDRCKLHHVIWWSNGGMTDIDNLLPVCSAHHTKIHNDGWIIELGPNRQLTLRLPDGTIRTTDPPSRRQPAA